MKSFKEQLSKIMNVGKSRLWISPTATESVKKAITKDDLKELVTNGSVKKLKGGKSRGSARILAIKKKKGRRVGQGRRKGVKTARTNPKDAWMTKVRAQRKYICEMKANSEIDAKLYKELYLKIKGGFFRSKSHIKLYVSKVKK